MDMGWFYVAGMDDEQKMVLTLALSPGEREKHRRVSLTSWASVTIAALL
jgi:hypothetical protein